MTNFIGIVNQEYCELKSKKVSENYRDSFPLKYVCLHKQKIVFLFKTNTHFFHLHSFQWL